MFLSWVFFILGITLSIHLAVLVATIFLYIGNFDIFPLDFQGIPLVLRNDETNTKALAFRARTVYDNKYNRFTNDGKVGSWERGKVADSFEVIIESKDNIFSFENLKRMVDIEEKVMSLEGYNAVCLTLISGDCVQPMSILRCMERIVEDSKEPITLNETTIDSDIKDAMCDAYNDVTYSEKLKVFLQTGYDPCKEQHMPNMTRLFFQFGISSNETVTFRAARNKRSIFQSTVLKPMIIELKENLTREGITLHYLSHELFVEGASEQAMDDAKYGAASFAFIFLIMWIQTASLWITFLGLYSIVSSFLLANLIYRYCFGFVYFGFFHVSAMFIIIGIGADDVFVFYNTWKLTKYKTYQSLAHRLTDFYHTAARTTFITSLTTTLVFIVTAFSPFLPVKSFGIFASLLVSVNYIFDLIYFPTAIIMYKLYIKPKYKKLHMLVKSVVQCLVNKSPKVPQTEIPSQVQDIQTKHRTNIKRKSIFVRIFSQYFYSFVVNRYIRVGIPVLFLGCSAFFVYWATKLTTSTGQVISLFPFSIQ